MGDEKKRKPQEPLERIDKSELIQIPGVTLIAAPTIEDIDQHSVELQAEFAEHARTVHAMMLRENPDALGPDGQADLGRLFQGWMIQKLSSLQLYIQYQESLIGWLANQLEFEDEEE